MKSCEMWKSQDYVVFFVLDITFRSVFVCDAGVFAICMCIIYYFKV